MCILQITRKLPDFSVQTFQFIVGKVYISVGRMFVSNVFVKVVLQQIALIFTSQQRIPFVNFFLIGYFLDQQSYL